MLKAAPAYLPCRSGGPWLLALYAAAAPARATRSSRLTGIAGSEMVAAAPQVRTEQTGDVEFWNDA